MLSPLPSTSSSKIYTRNQKKIKNHPNNLFLRKISINAPLFSSSNSLYKSLPRSFLSQKRYSIFFLSLAYPLKPFIFLKNSQHRKSLKSDMLKSLTSPNHTYAAKKDGPLSAVLQPFPQHGHYARRHAPHQFHVFLNRSPESTHTE